MLLSTFVSQVYVPARIEIAAQYEKKLYSVAAKFSTFLGRPAKLFDLTDQNVCNYIER